MNVYGAMFDQRGASGAEGGRRAQVSDRRDFNANFSGTVTYNISTASSFRQFPKTDSPNYFSVNQFALLLRCIQMKPCHLITSVKTTSPSASGYTSQTMTCAMLCVSQQCFCLGQPSSGFSVSTATRFLRWAIPAGLNAFFPSAHQKSVHQVAAGILFLARLFQKQGSEIALFLAALRWRVGNVSRCSLLGVRSSVPPSIRHSSPMRNPRC